MATTKILINHAALIGSRRSCVELRGENGQVFAMTPALARKLAGDLIAFADLAEGGQPEPLPERIFLVCRPAGFPVMPQ